MGALLNFRFKASRNPTEQIKGLLQWRKMVPGPFEVAVRVRLNIETLALILKPQSATYLDSFRLKNSD